MDCEVGGMTTRFQQQCACRGHEWQDSARACYTLRYYGIAGLGEPDEQADDGRCECFCHEGDDDEW